MALDILLTNDDGYSAAGLTTLYDALVAAGHTVHIVAPETNQGAKGSTLGGVDAPSQPITSTSSPDRSGTRAGRPGAARLPRHPAASYRGAAWMAFGEGHPRRAPISPTRKAAASAAAPSRKMIR